MSSDIENGKNLILTRLSPIGNIIDTKRQSATISFSAQVVTFSWHLCNRRDARIGSHTHAKWTIIRKKFPAKSNIFALNKTENTYRLLSSDYQTWQKVKLVVLLGAADLTQHRNII